MKRVAVLVNMCSAMSGRRSLHRIARCVIPKSQPVRDGRKERSMSSEQRLLPESRNLVPVRVDVSSAMMTRNPEIIADAILGLRAREAYLRDFIERGLDKTSNPLYGSGQPAAEELDTVQENLRVLAFRAAYAVRDKLLLPPLPEFDVVNKTYDVSGRVANDKIRQAVMSIPDQGAREAVMQVMAGVGRGLQFQGAILGFEGAKGFARAETPDPDRAFTALRAKLDALRAARKTDPKARATIRSDYVEEARKDPRWDAMFEAFYKRYSPFLTEYERVQPGETAAEILLRLQREKDGLQAKLSTGELTEEDWDRYTELSMEIERLTVRRR